VELCLGESPQCGGWKRLKLGQAGNDVHAFGRGRGPAAENVVQGLVDIGVHVPRLRECRGRAIPNF
jgi:hypothetical protein